LDGVVHVPFPVVFLGVAEGGGDSALSGSGMGTGGEELRHARDVGVAVGQLDSCREPRASCPDDNGVISVESHGTTPAERVRRGPRQSALLSHLSTVQATDKRVGFLESPRRTVTERPATFVAGLSVASSTSLSGQPSTCAPAAGTS